MTDNAALLPPATLASMFVFGLVSSITPGPNNLMLAISGVNFGLRRTVPQMAGITSGLLLIIIATGLGLGAVFSQYPAVRQLLQVLGILYTLWLAWKIASAGSLGGGDLPHPMRYGASFAFQWVNVKLWLMAIALVALYVRPGHALADTATITGTIAIINVPVMLLWAGFGMAMRDMLQVPSRIRLFNAVMGAALGLTVLPLLRM
jgi:threonine/homoserine/homoserine lactone efflux protein